MEFSCLNLLAAAELRQWQSRDADCYTAGAVRGGREVYFRLFFDDR